MSDKSVEGHRDSGHEASWPDRFARDRRRVLAGTAVVLTGAVAGCLNNSGSDDGNSNDGESDGGTPNDDESDPGDSDGGTPSDVESDGGSDVVIVDDSIRQDISFIDFVAENQGDERVGEVRVDVQAYDENGGDLESTAVALHSLEADTQWKGTLFLDTERDEIDSWDLEVQHNDDLSNEPDDLSVPDSSYYEDQVSPNVIQVDATVANNDNASHSDIEVHAHLYDEDGAVFATGYELIEESLAPGADTDVTVEVRGPDLTEDDVSNHEVFIGFYP